MRMKLSLATALAHHPRMLVLDEATSGLDPVVRGAILDLLLDFIQDETRSILISSHITSDLEQVADSIAYLHHGKLLFHEDKDVLLAEYGIARCSRSHLDILPADCRISTRQTEFGCETLVKDRAKVARLLPARCWTRPELTTSCGSIQGGMPNERPFVQGSVYAGFPGTGKIFCCCLWCIWHGNADGTAFHALCPGFVLGDVYRGAVGFDEFSHWDIYAHTLPCGLRPLVGSKYYSGRLRHAGRLVW